MSKPGKLLEEFDEASLILRGSSVNYAESSASHSRGQTKNVNKRQLIHFDTTDRDREFVIEHKVSKMIFNANLTMRGGMAVKKLTTQSRLLSSTIVRKLHNVEAGKDKEDLVVDYLDGDRSGIVVFGLNRLG